MSELVQTVIARKQQAFLQDMHARSPGPSSASPLDPLSGKVAGVWGNAWSLADPNNTPDLETTGNGTKGTEAGVQMPERKVDEVVTTGVRI